METDLHLAYSTLSALVQGQPVNDEELSLALACVARVIHQVAAMRRLSTEMARYLQPPTIVGRLPSRRGENNDPHRT